MKLANLVECVAISLTPDYLEIMELKIVKKKVKGNIIVEEDIQYNDVEAEDVIIENGVTARMYGNINGILILKPGSRLFLHGKHFGDIENKSGELHVFSGNK